VIPDVRCVVRTRPLEALVIGAYVRGLSDRDVDSLMDEAGLGHLSKNTASQLCRELRARYAAFCAKSLTDVELLVLFLDAVYLPTRPSGAKEGVLVAWGMTAVASACCWPSVSDSANRARIRGASSASRSRTRAADKGRSTSIQLCVVRAARGRRRCEFADTTTATAGSTMKYTSLTTRVTLPNVARHWLGGRSRGQLKPPRGSRPSTKLSAARYVDADHAVMIVQLEPHRVIRERKGKFGQAGVCDAFPFQERGELMQCRPDLDSLTKPAPGRAWPWW
jgi:mutator family transposase